MATRVLLVDDDEAMRVAIARGLEHEGYEVDACGDGAEAIDRFDPARHAAVVVDLVMPKADGMAVLRAIRGEGGTPVVFVSGHGDEATRVAALEAGADDFVAKPIGARELALRVRNTIGRGRAGGSEDVLRFDELEVFPARHEAHVAGQRVDLTEREFALLLHLARAAGQVVSRATLLQEVWESDVDWQSPDTVTEHVYRLRRKLEAQPTAPRWIHTVRGAGYRFDA